MDYGVLSLLPPIIIIIFAFLFKNVYIALLVGLAVGSFMLAEANVINTVTILVQGILVELTDVATILLLLGIMSLGLIVAVLNKKGYVNKFINYITSKKNLITTKKRSNLFAFSVGVVVFPAGNLSAMITGIVVRPVSEFMGVSKQKLAYIVDSTSTPVSLLIPASFMGVFIAGVLNNQGVAQPVATLLKTIPFNFYCIITVFGTLAFILSEKDIGPMAKAEYEAEQERLKKENSKEERPDEPDAVVGTPVDPKEATKDMAGLCAILILAFAVGSMMDELGTANYLISSLGNTIQPQLLPALIFIVTALAALATGTSVGVISIILPIAIPLAVGLGANSILVISAVLGGSIFGDHCSPIADTTLMSAMSTGCDLIDHVKTQMPYAILYASIATALYLITGFIYI